MSDDSSPWVPDKPPPNKLSEEYLKEEVKSARNGIGGFLMLGFALGRTLQVFSRRPGSSGLWLLLAWLLGVSLQGFYLIGHAEKFGRVDATPFEWLLAAQALAWLFCFAIACAQAIGRRLPPMNEVGAGILEKYLPKTMRRHAGIISDALIGGVLIVGLRQLGSPVQAGTYQVIVGWVMACHAGVFYRNWVFQQRIRSAKYRALHWHKDVRGRHHL